MDYLFLISRILLGGYFLMSGINHFTKSEMMTGYTASKGVPFPKLAVLGTGILLVLGGLGILLGMYVEWAVLSLAVFLIPTTFIMHAFWKATDSNMKMMEMIQFMKNMALLGAVLAYLFIPLPWPYSF